MKVVVLGGASFSTPAMFQHMRGEFAGSEFVLVARSARQVSSVVRAATLLAGRKAPLIIPFAGDAQSCGLALEGADVVLVQMRIGNMPAREFDETFPHRFDLCGDEGLGPGGVSAAWRSWPVIEAWLVAVQRHAPRALVLIMSSPVGILTRAVRVRFPSLRSFGVCEVPYVALQEIATLVQADFSSVTFEYLGVNHLGWLYAVRSAHRDLVDEWARHPARQGFPSKELIQQWGGIPTKYLRLHFEERTLLAAQKSAPMSRASELQALQANGLALYAMAAEDDMRGLLERRPTPWYTYSVMPLLQALNSGDSRGPYFLSAPNLGHCPQLPPDAVLEIACRVDNGCIERIDRRSTPPPEITHLIADFCEHERLAARAVMSRRQVWLEEALAAHPWVRRAAESIDDLPGSLARMIVAGAG